MWQPAHNKIQRSKIKDKTAELVEHRGYPKDKAAAEAESQFKGYMSVSTLTTPATVENLFEVFSSVHVLDINSKSALESAGKYSPNSTFIRKAKVYARFENAVAWYEKIKEYIRKAVPDNLSEDDIIKLVGKTISGEEKAYRIGENLREFGEFNFDNFVSKLPQKKWSDYKKCAALKVLLKLMKDKSIIFGLPPIEKTWRLPSATTMNRK